MTKLETYEHYKKLGFEETALKTWFCYYPIDGKPCGMCNPCMSVIEDGLTFRFTPEALNRYEKHKNRKFKLRVKAVLRSLIVQLGLLSLAKKILRRP